VQEAEHLLGSGRLHGVPTPPDTGNRRLQALADRLLDTSTISTGRLMLAIIGAVGRAEREAMLERQREGIAQAKRDGRHKSRAPTVRRQIAEIMRLKDSGVAPTEIATKLGKAAPAFIASWPDSTTENT
jgi:DNA invertase Pin-like site-specific DNA recombinase